MHQPISEPTTSFEQGSPQQQQSRELLNSRIDSDQCFFCVEKASGPVSDTLVNMIPEALFSKYASSQNYFYTKELDDIVEDGLSIQCARYRENLMLDDDEEYLKREYGQHEYERKIHMLSEYYKFHKDFPRFYGLPIEIAMCKYYDNRRDFDYKRIRQMLKQQQKMDFEDADPSDFSDSLVNHSSYVKRSRYSTMLMALRDESTSKQDESNALLDTLTKLNSIVKKSTFKMPNMGLKFIKNTNDEASIQRNRFENWLKREQRKPTRKLTINHNRKATPASMVRSPNVKMNFRKKKLEKTDQKILAPTKKQDENSGLKRNTYNSNLNLTGKNLFADSNNPLSGRLLVNQNDINKKHSISSKEVFESVRSVMIKPLIKNLDLINGIDFTTSKFKRSRREKSIKKIYGVKLRSVSMGTTDRTEINNAPLSSHRKSKITLDIKKSSKSASSIRQYRSSQYTKNTETYSRSPSNSLRKVSSKSSKVSLTTSKKNLPKLDYGLQNFTAMSKELRKYESVFSTFKNDNKGTVDKMLEKKMKVEPSINFQRLRSLI